MASTEAREADDTGRMFGNPDLPQREGVQLRAAWAEALGTTLSAFEGSSVTRLSPAASAPT